MGLKRAASWSLIDQSMLSGVHFAVGLTVLRLAPKSHYGVYVLSWSVLMLLSGLHNAWVNSQLTVRAAGLPDDQRHRIVQSYLVAQFCIYIPAAILALAGLAALWAWQPLQETAQAGMAVVIAFCGLAMREFIRTVLMLTLDARRVLLVDLGYVLVLVAIVIASAFTVQPQWLAFITIVALGIASLLGALPMLISLARDRVSVRTAFTEFRASGKHGAWASGGVVVTHLQSQSSIYLLGLFAGISVTAEASAARQFMMPVTLALTSLQRTLYPHWVALTRAGDTGGIRRTALHFFIGVTVIVAGYGTFLVLCSDTLIGFVLGAEYHASAAYLGAFALLTWAESSRSLVSLQMQALSRFRAITLANTFTAALVIGTTALLLRFIAPIWSVIIQALGEVLLALLLLGALFHRRTLITTAPSGLRRAPLPESARDTAGPADRR
jgi:O-antigen/teichoic acid export membrane protein